MDDVSSLPRDGQSPTARRFEQETKKSRGEAADAHKRRTSDGMLENEPFAETSAKEHGPSKLTRDADEAGGKEGSTRGSRIADALRPSGRKRKGSLRQGLLGKNILRRGPHENQWTSTQAPAVLNNTNMAETTPEEVTTPRPSNYDRASRISSSDRDRKPAAASFFSTTTTRSSTYDLDEPNPDVLASALAHSVVPYTSTTDDDEVVSFNRPSASSGSSYDTSSLQVANTGLHRRSNRMIQHTSLSTVQSPTDLTLEEEWDYSETEWWGWIILIGTWIVFVVGMGSCLGVWSWAWDVGETPYAPPELEDDPTLPITGYYPALMVCTAVMAWVWVVVAWVGMKYFRHSKMVNDDG